MLRLAGPLRSRCLALVLCCLILPGMSFFFEKGFDHFYTYSSRSDMFGMHNFTTVMKFRIRLVNHSTEKVHSLMLASFVQHSEHGYFVENPHQWDLSKRFYFRLNGDGTVAMVHYDRSDDEEVIALKKVLTSTLSAKANINKTHPREFVNHEVDHTGHLDHTYSVSRGSDGIVLKRFHNSSDSVHRYHSKTMRYNRLGTVEHVIADDTIKLRQSDTKLTVTNVPNAFPINDRASGDFPRISSSAVSKLTLTHKRPHTVEYDIAPSLDRLINDSILIKTIEKLNRTTLQQVNEEIKSSLRCIRSHDNTQAANRTECVHHLRSLIMGLQEEDYQVLASRALAVVCAVNDTKCADQRSLFMDIIGGKGDPFSQRLLLRYLSSEDSKEDDAFRILFHFIELENPLPELLLKLEHLCFGKDNEFHGSENLTKTQGIACLTLGSLAKVIKLKDPLEAERIVSKMEAWLGHHNETKSEPILRQRTKRSVTEVDHPRQNHIITKLVFINSLGNSGMEQSLDHIISYLQPNKGTSAWRRAAVLSLRHYTCNKSTNALLHTALYDEHHLVKEISLKAFSERLEGQGLSYEHYDMVLTRNYSYPALMRLKRGLVDIDTTSGFRVTLKLPGVDWRKSIGSKDIGAGFGLVIRNRMELSLKPLQGHFLIDVYNTAYAEAYCALLKIHIDIMRALICYNGHIGYDLNVLKDFGINKIQDVVKVFDNIMEGTINPIKTAVQDFKAIVQSFRYLGVEKMFNSHVLAVKNLPQMMKTASDKFVALILKVASFGGLPWQEDVKRLVARVKNFIEDVRDDVMGFYNVIIDAVTVTLPYIGKQLMDSISTIIAAIKYVLTNPIKAMGEFNRSLLKIKLVISMFVDVKNQVLDASFFLKGKTSYWMATGDELIRITAEVREFIDRLSSTGPSGIVDHLSMTLSDGIRHMEEQTDKIKTELIKELKDALDPLKTLFEVAKPAIDTFRSILDAFQGIKASYAFLRNRIIKAKSMIQKTFGPKFDSTFPKRRREENAACGQGVWPSTTGGWYKTTGVDVLITKGSNVSCPLNGMVYRNASSRLIVKPSDAAFRKFEIVIDNVDAESTIDSVGKYLKAGETIGTAGKSRCTPNFIHVSMRRRHAFTNKSDEDYDYVDPSPYLKRRMPIPRWVQECNEMTFIKMNKVYFVGSLGSKGAKKIVTEVKSKVKDKDIEKMDPAKEPKYKPADVSSNSTKNVGQSFMNGMKKAFSAFSGMQRMFTGGTSDFEVPNILEIINLKRYTVSKVTDILSPALATAFKNIVQKLAGAVNKRPSVPAGSFSIPQLRNVLGGAAAGLGDSYAMISKLFSMAESSCPTFRNGLNKGLGHICQAHSDCLGLSCELILPYGSVLKMVSIDMRVSPCERKLQIDMSSTKANFNLNGHDHHIPLFEFGGLNAELIINGDIIDNRVVLNVEATLCHEEYLSCIVRKQITTDMKFPQVDACDGSIPDRTGVPTTLFETMTLEDFILAISENDVMDLVDMKLIEKIRDAVVSELFENPNDLLQLTGKEFQDKTDFCIDGNIPIKPLEIVFFDVKTTFFVGPVPLSLGFGAAGLLGLDVNLRICFLSMVASVTVAPKVVGKVWGTAGISLGIATGGIKLIGFLMETQFPITGSVGFSKFPLDVTAKMDLILVPLKLDLRGFAELNLIIKKVVVFDESIWTYTTPTIKRNIFTRPLFKSDSSPPEFPPNSISSRKKREGPKGCLLEQVKNRSPLDAAFEIEVSTLDETSLIKLFYGIGTQHGGTNVVDWTEMGGASLLVPTNDLPNGVPLYWTVKARNTQGLEAFSYCMLPTYDTTIPDGRIDPSYKYSSHPKKISGTVTVFDDSTLEQSHEKAVGFSSGQVGSEFVSWDTLDIDKTTIRDGVDNDLKYFSVPRDGKLTALNFKTAQTRTVIECARLCLRYPIKCVSFDYEYHSEICDMHEVVEGPRASLRLSGTYKNYERLGVGHSSYVLYDNLDLQHANVYYINAKVTNTLGYTAYIASVGTTVDFTPPFTGPLGSAAEVKMQASQCSAAVTQRCIEVTWKENHKIIIDDKESKTVFNGHKPLQDEIYTINNHLASVNFDGFHDDESGIWGYTWMVGKSVCFQDIVKESDPHQHHSSEKYWTHNGYEKNLHLQDGPYFVTVRALNNVVFGGALVTTVCHNTPFTVDTTAPIFTQVLDIFYDEDFDLLAVYFNASDPLSHLARVDFGLGKTKHDVTIRGYELQTYVTRDEPFVAVEHLGLGHGVPAWLRLRAVNKVGLHTARHGDEQILIDLTPPNIGVVLDGNKLDTDVDYQADTTTMCAEWIRFFDEESGIRDYIWGVGTTPGVDDVVKYHNLTHHYKRSCVGDLTLQHNTTYYSTVKAYNAALNSKGSSSTSDGVLIDTTPPLPGVVWDGDKFGEDIKFSSETATKSCNWNNFTDRESHISKYDISLYINTKHIQTFKIIDHTQFTERSISMNHRDEIKFSVTAENGAGLKVDVTSDGFLVDHTTPVMDSIHDTKNGKRFQSFKDHLDVSWFFEDVDSGIKEYRYFINKQHQGAKYKSWPPNEAYAITNPSSNNEPIKLRIDQLTLVNGAKYSIVVTAINNALLSTSHESFGVVIDDTSPVVTKIHIGLPKEDEELDDFDRVLHVDVNILTVSWLGQDPESGIDKVYLGIGTTPGDLSITGNFIEFDGGEKILTLNDLNLQTFSESNKVYYASIKVINGAGLESNTVSSKPIVVLKANVPGQIFDGREESIDKDYTIDRASLAVTFAGFESEACDIRKYEWAIGSDAYKSDVLPYTGYGLVVHNSSHGQAQIHTDLTEGETYFVTVRAQPGHNCHEEYIVSSSDGIKLDTSDPEIHFMGPEPEDTNYIHYGEVYYQSYIDSMDFVWNVSDDSAVRMMSIAAGSLPFQTDVISTQKVDIMRTPAGFLSPASGSSTFLTLELEDVTGNRKTLTTDPVIADITPPVIRSLICTEAVSSVRSLVACSWKFVKEKESVVKSLTITVFAQNSKLAMQRNIPHGRREFSVDVINLLNATKEISVHLTISNILSQNTTYVRSVKVDTTPPSSLNVKVVTKMSLHEPLVHQRCQIPQTFVDVLLENASDEETDIEKLEVAIGSWPGHNDIHHYVEASLSGTIFFGGLDLGHGDIFYATARVTNKAGLSKMFYSDSVTVSVRPILTVGDGNPKGDEDYQSNLNIIRGFWRFSDTCSIDMVQWKVEDLLGNVIKDFADVAENAHLFYNDEFSLKNGFTYKNIIKVRDALNRTFTSASDGITVRIQPPNTGDVRDGMYEDSNYQQSVTEISANWDDFGDQTGDPTQTIRYYEVAIGDDHRFPKTRSNIHYYVNVGLNRSHTFRNLNLTAQEVTYYVTVRGISVAGTQDEASSNGIKVGFNNQIVSGVIETPVVQTDTLQIMASWTEFQSDIGIKHYLVGVFSSDFNLNISINENETTPCEGVQSSLELLDEKTLSANGLNTLALLQNLRLKHGHSYYVIVVAVNEADMCRYVTSSKILVDTTPPDLSTTVLHIGKVMDDRKDDIFIDESGKLQITWENITENESNMASFEVSLYQMSDCSSKTISPEFKIDSILVKADTKVTMYQLVFLPKVFYFVEVIALNTAGLKSSIISSRFRLDDSAPFKGDVKITPNWFTAATFQSSRETITSWMAVARSTEQYVCLNQRVIFPNQASNDPYWKKITGLYSPDFVKFAENKATLTIGYNAAQTKFCRSGLEGTPFSILSGNYSVLFKAASGINIITIISFASVSQLFPVNYSPPNTTTIDDITIPVDNLDDENISSTTQVPVSTPSASTSPSNTSQNTNYTINNKEDVPNAGRYGFGLSIMGTQQKGSDYWDAMFWVVGRYKKIEEWISLDTDPSESEGKVIFTVETEYIRGEKRHNIKLIVNGVIKAMSTGIIFGDSIKTMIYTVNDNSYEPAIENIFEPFRSEAIVASIQIPIDQDLPCLHGSGFFDEESGIKEIWVGISDNKNSTDNVSPMRLYQSLCLPCEAECLEGCQETCQFDDFTLTKIEITGLNLLPTITSSNNASENSYQTEESHTYYVTIKAVNFAGLSSISRSNGIMIDTTPAVCEYVRCLDPYNSMEEPTMYIGTNNSVGAYWSCSDAESEVNSYSIGVGTSQNNSDLYNMTNVGLLTKRQITLKDDNLFSHGHTYYFNVWAYNAAGSPGKYSCQFTVELFAPDVGNVSTKSLFEYHPTDGNTDQMANVSFTVLGDSIGVTWASKEDIAAIYEWGIGTAIDVFDILPMIRVGVTKSGQAKIIHGHVWFNDEYINATVSRFHNQPNATRDGSLFLLEPGRCLHHSLIAVGRSHIRRPIPIQPTCITRPNDYRLTLNETQNATLITVGDVAIGIKAPSGGVMIGSLSNDDLSKTYGTDASDEFSSAIVDPISTMMDTSRQLRKRLQGYQGHSFFISPMPFIEPSAFEITISMPINQTDYDNDTVPALALWSAGKWIHVQEECDAGSLSKLDNPAYFSAKVCHQTLVGKGSSNTRRKREVNSDPTPLTQPYQFGLFKMTKSCVNTAPTIITDTIYTVEDTAVVNNKVMWSDADGDRLIFSSKQPTSGQVTITHDGFLTFIPPQEFSGQIQLIIEAEEISICNKNHTVSKVITIHISGVDDAPLAGFLSHDNNFTLADNLNAEIVIFLEGNNTEHYVGSLLLVDADVGDNLRLVHRTLIQTDAIFIQEESSDDLVPTNTFAPIQSSTYKRIDFTLKTHANFTGHLHYQLLGSDQGGQMTARFNIHLFVLISPCNYGTCAQTDLLTYPCNDSTRAFSFDTYTCACHAGYEGHWCDEEIDECAGDPCPTLFDCTDHVAFHTCDINPGYLSAILLSTGLVAVGTCILLIYLYKKKNGYSKGDSSMWNLYDDKSSQGSASQPQPSIVSTQAISLSTDSVFEPSTDTEEDHQPDALPGHFKSKSRTMYRSPLSLSQDIKEIKPGTLRNPLERKNYKSVFKTGINTVQLTEHKITPVDI